MSSVQEISPEGDDSRSGLFATKSEIPTLLLSTQTKPCSDEIQEVIRTKLSLDEDVNNDAAVNPSQASRSDKDQAEKFQSEKLTSAMKSNKEIDAEEKCESNENKPVSKSKNARKQRKQLKIPPVSGTPAPQPNQSPNQAQFPPMSHMPLNGASVQDFFINRVSPLYANTSSGYMQNVAYHPQYQYMQNQMNMQQMNMQAGSMQQQTIHPGMMTHAMQNAVIQQALTQTGMQQTIQMTSVQQTRQSMGRQHSMQTVMQHQYAAQQRPQPASAPSTPVVIHQRPSSGSIPNSPNAGYFQNMMQHPLLSQSFNAALNMNAKVNEVRETPDSKASPKKTKNNKKNEASNDDKRFDCYMAVADVEVGLKNNTLLKGVLKISPKQFQCAFISSLDRDEQDVFIDGLRNRNRALEGDVVVVKLIENAIEEKTNEKNVPDEETSKQSEGTSDQQGVTIQVVDKNSHKTEKKDQKRGIVVYIQEKVHTRTCIGNLKLMPDKNRQRALFIPRDYRIPRLSIPFTYWPDNFYEDAKKYEKTLFLAKILSWTDTRFAIGKIMCNIGQSGNMKTETLAILAENDLDITPYGPEVRDLFPDSSYTIPEEEIKSREDCRNLCIFSIDPSNCRDIDDAVSCRELSNENYEIGVHISDVAYYLTEDTILDEKVAQKATTIYLVERAYHMLPDELCMLCSLFPGVDKLAFSVFWEITKDGQVLSHRFAKTVINSCSQLAYAHAQAIIEKKDDAESSFPETYNNFKYQDICKAIEIIAGIARIFRRNRFENGALRIDQPKVAFHLSPVNGLPESYSFYEIKESHQMIEEFMLLANITVARRIYEDHPKLAFLRCHPPPSGFMLRQLAKALDPMGIELDISSSGALHRSLLAYTDPETTEKGRAMVLNMLCAKPMTRAKYFCADTCDDDDFLHYALNIPIYTHFTSPIRRYADIMVHRLLAASLKVRENPKWEVDKVRMIASQCNKQKYNAKRAGEMSSDLYMLKYIEMNSPIQTEAVVVEVREKYIDVIVVTMGLNRRIFFNPDFPGDFNCIKHECGSIKMSKMEITWRAEADLPETKQVIEVFSTLQVHLYKSDDMVKVETKIIRPQ